MSKKHKTVARLFLAGLFLLELILTASHINYRIPEPADCTTAQVYEINNPTKPTALYVVYQKDNTSYLGQVSVKDTIHPIEINNEITYIDSYKKWVATGKDLEAVGLADIQAINELQVKDEKASFYLLVLLFINSLVIFVFLQLMIYLNDGN